MHHNRLKHGAKENIINVTISETKIPIVTENYFDHVSKSIQRLSKEKNESGLVISD